MHVLCHDGRVTPKSYTSGLSLVESAEAPRHRHVHFATPWSSALGLLTTCVTPATFDGGYLPRRHTAARASGSFAFLLTLLCKCAMQEKKRTTDGHVISHHCIALQHDKNCQHAHIYTLTRKHWAIFYFKTSDAHPNAAWYMCTSLPTDSS